MSADRFKDPGANIQGKPGLKDSTTLLTLGCLGPTGTSLLDRSWFHQCNGPACTGSIPPARFPRTCPPGACRFRKKNHPAGTRRYPYLPTYCTIKSRERGPNNDRHVPNSRHLVRFYIQDKVLYLFTRTSILLSHRLFPYILSCFGPRMRKIFFRAGNLLRTASW